MQEILLQSGSHRLCQWDHTPPLSHFSTFHLQEVSGKLMAKVIHHIKKCFSKPRRRKKSKNRKKRCDAISCALTEVQRLSPGTIIGKYWLFQLLCLLFVLGWQSKQLDRHSTGFHPDKISPLLPPPRTLSAHTVLLSPCGGPQAHQSRPCGSSSGGDKQPQPSGAAQHCTEGLGHFGDWVLTGWLLVSTTGGKHKNAN